jgi:hypothetical protein
MRVFMMNSKHISTSVNEDIKKKPVLKNIRENIKIIL